MSTTQAENEARFRAYMDGTLDEAACTAFEADVEADEALMDAFLAFQEADMPSVDLDPIEVPAGFEKSIERRIRRRSRGRFFNERAILRQRFYGELLIAIALVVLGAIYLVATPDKIGALIEVPEVVPADQVDEDEEPDTVPPAEGEATPGAESPTQSPALTPSTSDVIAAMVPREGRTSNLPIAPNQRREFIYTVNTSLAAEALHLRLRQQFGADNVTVGDTVGTYVVWVDRAHYSDTVMRIEDLGPLDEERLVPETRDGMLPIYVRAE